MPKAENYLPFIKSCIQERYFDRQGKPFSDLREWERRFGDSAYKRVAEATLADGTWVSTVWLGLNHNWGAGPPLIFETMVFPSKDGPFSEQETDRYATEAEALAGHAAIVKKWAAKVRRKLARMVKREAVLREVEARTKPVARRLLSLEG